jgi:selenide,water dikinase
MCSDAVIEEFTLSMAALNRRASEIMSEAGISTATDVTGFGLIGHLSEVLSASQCRARLYSGSIPFFDDAVRLVKEGVVPGGTLGNLKIYDPYVTWAGNVSEHERVLMNDAQTSGGLLIFVPDENKEKLVTALEKEGILAAYIGDVVDCDVKDGKRILVEQK